jgi:two-component system LytT family response regulator
MIRTLIIDDEEKNRTAIAALVAKHCPELDIVGEAASAEEGYRKIEQLAPHLVLLDVKMPGHSGFALLKRFEQIDFEVIFITAYDRYAIHAFEFNAVDYIMKPVSVTKLQIAVGRALERIKTKNNSELVMHFIQSLSDRDEALQKLSVHHNDRVVFIIVAEICSIESKTDTTTISLQDGKHYYSSKDLVKFEQVLEGNGNFIRINKSVIINIRHIKSYSKSETCTIEMITSQTFDVSKRRKHEILQKLKNV